MKSKLTQEQIEDWKLKHIPNYFGSDERKQPRFNIEITGDIHLIYNDCDADMLKAIIVGYSSDFLIQHIHFDVLQVEDKRNGGFA